MHKAFASINNANAYGQVENPFGGKNKPTRMGLVILTVGHGFDHYGQSVEYLRMTQSFPPQADRGNFPNPTGETVGFLLSLPPYTILRMSAFQDGLLKGKLAVITGGGSGINLRIAERFARQGAKLALIGRRQEKLDAAVQGIAELEQQASGFPPMFVITRLSNAS